MTNAGHRDDKADYGVDAPVVIRNLFLGGVLCVLVWGSLTVSALSGRYHIPMPIVRMAGIGFVTGITFISMGLWMLWEGKIGKLRERDNLLQKITWTGREQVLDVGCGRGLMLIGAAKRLTSGKATGIDIWQAEDLTGNHAESTMENARREGVAEHVEVQSADMRQMPFADDTFDVVVSRAAIHNIYNAADRAQAIREIARVLKPGGQVVIDDIRHLRQYSSVFAQNGCGDIQRFGSRILSALLMLITFGSLRPGTIVVRKSSAHG